MRHPPSMNFMCGMYLLCLNRNRTNKLAQVSDKCMKAGEMGRFPLVKKMSGFIK